MEIRPSAKESLAIAYEAQNAALRRSRSPWWYFPATGVVVGATAVAVLLGQGIGIGVAVILMAVALPILESVRRRVTGTRITEFGHGRATGYAAVFLALGLVTLAAGWFFVMEQDVTWVAWVTGLVVGVFLTVGGWIFERTLSTAMKR